MNDFWHSGVVGYRRVCSRHLWLRVRFSKVKLFVVVVYDPTEGDVQQREKFWVVDRVGDWCRLYVWEI